MEQQTWVYVLALQNNKYYVGTTSQPQNRIMDHVEQNGSAWTKRHMPVALVECTLGDRFDEDKTTKRYMARHGIENVRGGSYANCELSETQRTAIQSELATVQDRCFQCGQQGHFVNACPTPNTSTTLNQQKQGCVRCGRMNHTVRRCYARFHVEGFILTDSDSSSSSSSDYW